MTETSQQNPPAGDPSKAGGDGGDAGGSGGSESQRTVSYDTHRKLLEEKKRAQSELDALRAEKTERERKESEAKGEYQKLLDQERAARAETEAKLKTHEEQEKGRRKLAAILANAGGNIDRKWFPTIQSAGILDQVVIDPDTGEVDPMSVTRAISTLKTGYPELIVAKGGPKTPNADPKAGASGVPAGKISRSEWMKLSSAEMKKWKPDQVMD